MRMRFRLQCAVLAAMGIVTTAGIARAEESTNEFTEPLTLMQIANPANASRSGQDEPTTKTSSFTLAPQTPRVRSYDAPPVVVAGENPSGLVAEDRIGTYNQPRWTATRRFPNTRVYVVPEGKVEVEYWVRPTFKKDGTTETRTLYELEIGLPYRFQLDLYLRSDQEGDTGSFEWGHQFEVRWALADWGVIPGNPTLYFEYINLEDQPDKIEPKLLLGGELAPRWHWGVNLVAELQLGDEREYEYEITGGLSYLVIDPKFSIGMEGKATFADVKGNRGTYSESYLIGPDFQFKPLPPVTINFVALVGIGPDSPDAQLTLNIGYEF